MDAETYYPGSHVRDNILKTVYKFEMMIGIYQGDLLEDFFFRDLGFKASILNNLETFAPCFLTIFGGHVLHYIIDTEFTWPMLSLDTNLQGEMPYILMANATFGVFACFYSIKYLS